MIVKTARLHSQQSFGVINLLLEFNEMYEVLASGGREHDGILFVGNRPTGLFCRASCPARAREKHEVAFFEKAADAVRAGFQPCPTCQPMQIADRFPGWVQTVVSDWENDPLRIGSDTELRQRGVDPQRLRRWFLQQYGITFAYFLRRRRLARALRQTAFGEDLKNIAQQAGYDSVSRFQSDFQDCFGFSPQAAATDLSSLQVDMLPSPLGPLLIAADSDQVFLLEFADRKRLDHQFLSLARQLQRPLLPGHHSLMEATRQQLDEYFAGTRQQFDLPLAIHGTKFQQAVWNELLRIGYGQTVSYDQVARQIGKPKAQRAVGRTNGENRIAILIPCHRVIRQDGTLSGYGGGVRRKAWLIEHEKAHAASGIGTL